MKFHKKSDGQKKKNQIMKTETEKKNGNKIYLSLLKSGWRGSGFTN